MKTAEQPEQMMTVEEVANILRMSRSQVYHLINTRRLPAMRVGRFARVPASGLAQWQREQVQAWKTGVDSGR